MSPRPTFLALDLGTTSIKGAVLDPERRRIDHARSVPFPAPAPGQPPGFCEIDPRAIVAAARSLLDQLRPHAPACAGLLICGQMGGLVLTSDHGEPLSPYLSWRDQRLLQPSADGRTLYDAFLERLDPAHHRELGHEVRAGATLSYLFWLARAGQFPANAIAATLPDFVAACLCGAAPLAHRTLAVGLLHTGTQDWHHAAFEALSLGLVRWPRLAEVTEPVGHVSIGERKLPCYAPVGDQQCALAGAGLTEYDLSLNISTGSQASRLARSPAPSDCQTRPYFDGLLLNTLTHLPAGRALNALLALLDELPAAQGRPLDDPWPYVEQAAAALPSTDLRVNLAVFPGPAGERGAIANLHAGNLTLGHLFRAAYDNMAENYHAAALRLWPEAGWQGLLFSGGLARHSQLLRALIAAKLGGQPRLAAAGEETLAGLLALALVIHQQAPTVLAATDLLRPPQPS